MPGYIVLLVLVVLRRPMKEKGKLYTMKFRSMSNAY